MDKQVNLGNTILDYQDIGEGYPVMFLHGALSNAKTWERVIPSLSRHFRCILPTLPLGGHKHPIHATTPITGAAIAALIRQLADHLGLERFALLGNDTGGAYAQIFTAHHPERVSHLMLSNCDGLDVFPPKLFGTLPIGMRIPGFTRLMALAMRSPTLAKSNLILGALSHHLDGQTIQRDYLHTFITDRQIRQDFKMLALGWDTQETLSAAEALKTFQQPVLLIWGLGDTLLFPLSLGERLAAIFPNARLQTIDGASTYVHVDCPEQFAAAIHDFLGQLVEVVLV